MAWASALSWLSFIYTLKSDARGSTEPGEAGSMVVLGIISLIVLMYS